MSFKEMRNREIINEVDGRRLGRVRDIIFSPHRGEVLGLIAPFYHRLLPIFRGEQVYIPFKHIVKIGPDVILVRLTPDLCRTDGVIDMKKERGDRHGGGGKDGGGGRRHERGGKGEVMGEFYQEEGRHGGHGGGERGREHDGGYDEHGRGREKRGERGEGGKNKKSLRRECDKRCEKCMMFDCEDRWDQIK